MNSLSCLTLLLVISTAFSTPFSVGGGGGGSIGFGGSIGGGGSVGSGGGGGGKTEDQPEEGPEPKVTETEDQPEEEPEPKVTELKTPNKLEYHFFPVSDGEVFFEVKAPHDAHVALTTGPTESTPLYEIIIGGWKNSRTVIRKNKVKSEKAVRYTTKVVNEDEFSGFWVRWDEESGTVSITRENEDVPITSWKDPEPITGIKYIGVLTAHGATGIWRMRGEEVDKDGKVIISTSS